MRILIFLLMPFFVSIVHANELTLVHGKIINHQQGNAILVFFSNENQLETTNIIVDINENGEFKSNILIEESQVITLKYKEENIKIYIDPGEKIGVLLDQKNNKSTINFFEKEEEIDNEVYRDFNLEFGNREILLSSNIFISTDLYAQLKDLSSQDRYNLIKQTFHAEENFYNQVKSKKISLGFSDYLSSEIRYNYLAYLLFFVKEKELKAKDRREYLKEISNEVIDNKTHKKSSSYTRFLQVHAKCNCEEELHRELDYFQDFSVFYQCVRKSEILDKKYKEKILGSLIYHNIRPSKTNDLTPLFNDYKKTTTNSKLLKEISDRFELALSLQDGQFAPDFSLESKLGKKTSLKDFRGKKIYINFWAKWCGACKAEIIQANENRKRLKKEPIVFIFISIDESKTTWANHSITINQLGIHLWGGSDKNNLMTSFGIASLPKTFLLDEDGKFVTDFPKSDSEDFIKFIKGQ